VVLQRFVLECSSAIKAVSDGRWNAFFAGQMASEISEVGLYTITAQFLSRVV
jgi:hypothetical protein